MKIFITGGSGFVGRHLSRALILAGHRVTAVGRSHDQQQMIHHANFTYLAADTTRRGDWQARLADTDVAINLAGKSIFTRWTANAKKEIYDSRILTTRNLVDGLSDSGRTAVLSASAVGYYGHRGEDLLSEGEPAGDDFLASVALDWEQEALRARTKGCRVVLTRFGAVLGRGGGVLDLMIPAFRMFLGGKMGSGQQWLSWIHLHDLTNAFHFLLEQKEIQGPVNLCTPKPVRNQDLAKALGEQLGRPAVMAVPVFAVRGLLGDLGEALMCSQRVIPDVLVKAGFNFTYLDISEAIKEILSA